MLKVVKAGVRHFDSITGYGLLMGNRASLESPFDLDLSYDL